MALPKQRKTETMSVSESRKQYSEILNRVYRNEERVVIEKNGIPVAAIVPIADLRQPVIPEEDRIRAVEAFRAVQDAFADAPEAELERELERALAEAKAFRVQKQISDESADTER